MHPEAPVEDVFRIVNILKDKKIDYQVVRLADRTPVVTDAWADYEGVTCRTSGYFAVWRKSKNPFC